MKTTENPLIQEFTLPGVNHISAEDAFELLTNDQAVLIDVRDEDEVEEGNIPLDKVLYHPMPIIIERLPYISKDQHIIIACAEGIRSVKVANLLNIKGYPSVTNLDGGLAIWQQKKLPYVQKSNPKSGCGCGCSCSSNDSCN